VSKKKRDDATDESSLRVSADPIAAWRAHPAFMESAIQATADFMQSVADHEAAGGRAGRVTGRRTPRQ